jgi:hypothetical protein
MGSHGLAHVSKEIGTAQAVASAGTLMIPVDAIQRAA